MKHSLFTLFLSLSSVIAFGQTYIENRQSIFTNTLEAQNGFRVDTITVTKGLNTIHLKADTIVVGNGIKSKNLTADDVKINNTLTANTVTASNFNFTNSLDLTGNDLRVGNHASTNNTNFVLRYNNAANIGAMFAFFKGDGIPANTVREATISKIAGQPLVFSTDAAENIVFKTNTNTPTLPSVLVVGGNGNVGIGANPMTSEKLYVEGNLKTSGNANIGSSPTTDSLTVNGKLRVMGNIGIGTSSTSDKLTVDGSARIEGSNPYIHLKGDAGTTNPIIKFSGLDDGGTYRDDYTQLSGAGGGFRILTRGALYSQVIGTQANTLSKQLHVYRADNWSGYATIESRGLYGGAVYANAIDYSTGTRLKIEQNQYTGGLLMGYSNTASPLLSNYTASVIKSQYMGNEINTVGQHKFDMVFGINSDGNGGFSFDPTERMRIKDNGIVNVGRAVTINTNLLPTTGNYRLAVGGDIIAEKIVITTLPNWPDYVFNKNYNLTPLSKVEEFIEKNGHLPNVPSAAEVKKDGIELGVMNAKLLEKVEELTLHLINQQKQIDELKNEVKNLKKKN
jgi:hypothetical protein